MDPYALMGVAACVGLAWTVTLAVAFHRNDHARVTVHPDGGRTLHLVDFGLFLPTGAAVAVLMVVSAIWFGLTVN